MKKLIFFILLFSALNSQSQIVSIVDSGGVLYCFYPSTGVKVPMLPSTVTGQGGKYLTNNGSNVASWGSITTITGNAGTATALQTPRNINGVSFDGTGNITVAADASTLTNTTLASGVVSSSLTSVGTITAGVWHGTAIGDTWISSASTWNSKAASGANTDITSVLLNQTGLVVKGATTNALTIKPNETLTAGRTLNIITNDATRTLTIAGDATVSGTNTGDQTTVSGNAGTATALQNARTINGVSFDGTGNITVAAAAGTLTGTTLASNVVTSSLTSVGTIGTGVWQGTAIGDTWISSASTWNSKAASGANTDITSVLLSQTGLVVKGATSNALTIKPNETLTAGRVLNIITGDATRTLTFSGDATISGTNTGDQTTVSGNAGSATVLQTARNINGVSFNGSADITVTAAAGTLTGGTLNSGVTASSLTSFGSSPTIVTPSITTGLTIGGTAATGTILRGNGTNFVASTTTFPNAATTGDIIVATGTNALGSLAIGTPGQTVEALASPSWTYGNGQGSITSASGSIANSETKILSSSSSMIASRLQAGTVIEVVLHGTCTSSAAGAGTVNVRYGTAGTTSDGLLESFTLGAAQTSGTTIPFVIRIYITIRTTGSSATADGVLELVNQGTTGISTTATQVIRGSNTTINTTTASTFLTVSYQSGNASTASTFQDAAIKISFK